MELLAFQWKIAWTAFFQNNLCRCADDNPLMQNYQVSREKAKSLGVEFTTLEESIKETVESLKEKKFFGGSSAM